MIYRVGCHSGGFDGLYARDAKSSAKRQIVQFFGKMPERESEHRFLLTSQTFRCPKQYLASAKLHAPRRLVRTFADFDRSRLVGYIWEEAHHERSCGCCLQICISRRSRCRRSQGCPSSICQYQAICERSCGTRRALGTPRSQPASGDRVVTVTVEDRHASAVMGILDMQAPVTMTEAPLPIE